MRIHISFITLLFMLPLLVLGQEQTVESSSDQSAKRFPISHQIGISGTSLLKQFISLGDSSIAQSPYILTYKFCVGPFALRTGFGGGLNSAVGREEGYADSETEEERFADIRVGLEYQANMGQKWQGSFGVDAVWFGHERSQVSDTGFDVVSNITQTKGTGFGPIIGLRYLINSRFSLYTEGAFYYTSSDQVQSRLFSNFPQFDDQLNDIAIKDFRIAMPATIYLVYEF